jgi:hypothetical protein
MSKDDADFNIAMRQMGVQPLKGGNKTTAHPPPPNSPPELPVVDVPRSAVSPEQESAPRETEKDAALGIATRSIAALEQELVKTREELESARAEARHLASVWAAPTEGEASLRSLMQDRGLRGQEEGRRATLALLNARRWEGLEALLSVERPQVAREVLGLGVFLHCGQEDCPAPETCAVVQVPPRRCEVCGGGSVQWDALNDALLLGGIREFVVLGGHPHVQGLLREQVDRRVELRAFPSHAPVPGGRAGTLKEARLLLRWETEPGEDESLLGCSDPSLAGLVDFAIHALAQR